MPNVKLLAEKYNVVQENNSIESLVESSSPETILKEFNIISQVLPESTYLAFEHAIESRQGGRSIIEENADEQDNDIKLTVMCIEKVLKHLDTTSDKNYCLAFESFARGKKKEEEKLEDEDVNPNGDPSDIAGANSTYPLAGAQKKKPGFLSQLGSHLKNGIQKYGTKLANGLANVPAAVGQVAGATANGLGQAVGAVGGAAQGLGHSFKAGAKYGYQGAKQNTGLAGDITNKNLNQTGKPATAANTAPAADAPAPTANTASATPAPAAAPAPLPAAPAAPAPAGSGRVNVGDAKKAIDAVAAQLSKVQSRDRKGILDYALNKLAEIEKAQNDNARKKPAAGQIMNQVTPANTQKVAAEQSVIKEFYIINNKHFRK